MNIPISFSEMGVLVPSITASIIEGLGVLALLALAFSSVERQEMLVRYREWVIRGIFMVSVVFVMYTPFEVLPGIIVDARHIVLGLAASFGGILTALATGAAAIIFRIYTGGVGVSAGIVGICISVGAGVVFKIFVQPRILEIRIRHLLLLASLVSLTLLSLFFIPREVRLEIFLTAGVAVIIANFIGILFLGSFLSSEQRRILREQTSIRNALIDPLTGLYNRRGFIRAAVDALNSSKVRGLPSAIMVLDCDRFKSINDQYGHQTGDAVLVWIANCIKENVRPGDISTRSGGDEFVVLLPGSSEEHGMIAAERLRSKIEESNILVDTINIKTSVSIGVAEVSFDAKKQDYFFHTADAALYEAKRQGGNSVRQKSRTKGHVGKADTDFSGTERA